MNTRKIGCLELTTFLGALCFVRVVDPDPDEERFDDTSEQLVTMAEPVSIRSMVSAILSLFPRPTNQWRLA